TAEETMRIWDHDKILSDVVWVVRKFRPDVIVTRFSPEDQLTHGHHTASAILAREAFSAAGDPNRFPEQLAFVKPWRPTRLVWNTSPFFFSNRNLPFDPTGLTVLEAGGYNSLLGKAYTEIAAASVTMHKSQGVGSPPRRGTRKEYFKLLEGQPMTNSLFEGIDTSWSRVANSESIATEIRQIISQFHPADPAASVPELLKLRQTMSGTKDDSWVPEKKAALDQIIAACLGLHVEASTNNEAVTPGQTATIKLEAINRCEIPVTLQEIRFPLSGESMKIDAALPSTNSLRGICHVRFRRILLIPSPIGFVNLERLAPSRWMIKPWSACPKIRPICPSRLSCRSMARNSVISWIRSTAWSIPWRASCGDRSLLSHPFSRKS